jgi:hypothetical protein
LRAAILNANSGDTILFICSSAPCTIVLNGPLPPITSNLTIDGGTFGRIVIDGNSLYRVFFVDVGTVALSHLQIQNALAQGGNGGASALACGGGGAGLGAGLFVNGATAAATVTVTQVYFLQNSAAGGNGGCYSGYHGSGGGGGLGGNGGDAAGFEDNSTSGGGGGVLGPGANGSTTSLDGAAGGLGGGGGGDQNRDASAAQGPGGAGYASNAAGANGTDSNAGNGGFGGGGGGSDYQGGNGGFGGGGGGSGGTGGAGGPGGGGGGGRTSGAGGILFGAVQGGAGGMYYAGPATQGGGGAAAGPDIFVNQGTLTTIDSVSSGAIATGGPGGTFGPHGGNGGSDATPVFNYNGTVNGSSAQGPIAGALPGNVVSALSFSVPASATPGASFSFSVTALNPSDATDTFYNGTVHFTCTDLSATLPADTTFASGVSGTLTATFRTPGNQTITATDTVTSSITGTSGTIAVSAVSTSTSVSPSSATVTYGTAQTFTATVTSGGFAVTAGTVTFTDTTTATTLASGLALNGIGQAATTATLAAGGHTIQATYVPDASHAGSSNTTGVNVNKATLTVTANNAGKVYGAPLPAFAATITGFVHSDPSAVVGGSASLTTTATALSPVAGYAITVTAGTLAAANYTFTFVSGTLTVSKASTGITLIVSAGTLAATVTVVPPGAGTPTGTVQFLNGNALLGTVPLTGTTASLPGSVGTIVAVYSGDGNFSGSASNPVTIYPPATSSLSLTSSVNPSSLGQAVTFTAVVGTSGGPPGTGPPTGSVQFSDGAALLGSGTVSGGRATFSTSALTGGHHTIMAQYSGDSTWPTAQASYGQTVNAPVTITVTSSAASVYGQAVTLTANVSATVPAGFAAPTGQVTFSLAPVSIFGPSTPLGTAPLTSGTATLSVTTLAVGTETIAAQYSGDGTWNASSGSTAVTVSPAFTGTAVSLAIASGQIVLASAVAAVAPGAGTPTGSVQFVDTSNHTPVSSASLSGGKASATIAAGAASTVLARPISAVYSGDGNFKGSASTPLPAVVNAAANLSASFAADEIASLFGIVGLTGDTPAAQPLTTSLAGVTVNIADSAGTSRLAPLYGVFASAGQINFLVPAGSASGLALVTIALPGGATPTTAIDLANTAPGIFTANMDGQGPYAGQVIYVHADGSQTVANSAAPSAGGNTYVPLPIDLGTTGDQVFLVLYGTGLRHAGALTAALNGVSVPVAYFGAQGSYAGLDQINLGPLPATLAGAGLINLAIGADGQAANTVTVAIQ